LQTLELEWEETDPPDRWEPVPVPDQIRTTADQPTWVLLKEPEEDGAEDTLDQFLEARTLFSDRDTKKGRRLFVLARNVDEAKLQLSSRPDGEKIFLRPDDTVLLRQRSALERLQNAPVQSYRGLLRLVESGWVAQWENPNPVALKEEDWQLLVDPGRSGTLEQRQFVELALGTEDFAILNGPPGSGKTMTICEYILQEVKMGHKVLLAASTHVAVDNVLEKLHERGMTQNQVIAVRIGDEGRVSEVAKDFLLKNWVEKERKRLVSFLEGKKQRTASQDFLYESLKENTTRVIESMILETANLACGTTMGILSHPDLRGWGKREHTGQSPTTPPYDVLVVDECSKTTFTEFLVPALLAKKWILVGDSKQLSPYVDQGWLQANLDGIVPREDSAICAPFLDAPPRSPGIILAFPTKEEREKARVQATGLGLTSVIIERKPGDSGLDTTLELWGSEVAVLDSRVHEAWEQFLPPGMLNHTSRRLPLHSRRSEARIRRLRGHRLSPVGSHTREPSLDETEAEEWSYEVGWRLIRAFELRHEPERSKTYLEQIDKLIPRWYPESRDAVDESTPGTTQMDIHGNIELVYRVAFPSILDILEEGVPAQLGREEVTRRDGSALSVGLGEALKSRLITLTYQHRMHPEISRIPREHIYDGRALKDAEGIEKARRWPRPFPRYPYRAHWLHVQGKVSRGGKNENLAEVTELVQELESFRKWCRVQPPPSDSPGKNWRVAVLTFYTAQERALRYELQNLFKQPQRIHRFDDASAKLEVRLGVVDRFQGQEADVVFLSMVRTRPLGVGFLDNPNRVNVALTRARFQLVIIGDKHYFAKDPRASKATLCRAVAVETSGGIALGRGWL
jgi:hypothetical protein